MNYMYSNITNSFYPLTMREDYQNAGSWPEGAIEVNEETYIKFTGIPPEGKCREAGLNGLPAWVDNPAPTDEELNAAAKEKKTMLLEEAQAKISLWQTELQLGIISDDDKASLINWLAYIKALQAVDTGAAPEINWPELPVI